MRDGGGGEGSHQCVCVCWKARGMGARRMRVCAHVDTCELGLLGVSSCQRQSGSICKFSCFVHYTTATVNNTQCDGIRSVEQPRRQAADCDLSPPLNMLPPP